MTHPKAILRPVLAIGAIAVLALLVWWMFLRGGEARTLTGYIEGERVYLAAPVSGAVSALYVREGERVATGGRTFLIDPAVQRAQAGSAAAAVGAAEARVEDLRKGQRAEELSVFDAELAAAEAAEREAEAEYGRIEPLVRRGIYAPARLDQVRAARDSARARTAAARRRREVATLGARQDAVAQAAGAAAAVGAAEARAEDLRKGQRAEELSVFDAELQAAQAAERVAEADFARIEPLVRQGIYAPARLDQVRAARDAARARTAAVQRRREVASLGAREDAISQAEQQAAQAMGGLGEAEARLGQLSPTAPTAARVEEIFYRPGEWAAANTPVLALLPDSEVKLVFFVPEAEMARYRPGGTVRFTCDGCAAAGSARISWVSPRPEFTPPILYSKGSRDRLVYRVEARPANAATLNPGLPVDVTPLESGE